MPAMVSGAIQKRAAAASCDLVSKGQAGQLSSEPCKDVLHRFQYCAGHLPGCHDDSEVCL